MQFGASKDNLLAALSRVGKIIKWNPRSVPIRQCVKIESYGNNLFVVATSTMANARVQVEGAVISDPGEPFVVNYDKFKDRVSKAGDVLAIVTDGGSMQILSSSDQKLGLALSDIREFPETQWEEPEESYGLDKNKFATALTTSGSMSSSSSLTPALLQVSIKDQTVTSGNRVAYQILPMQCNPELRSTIPTSTIPALVTFISESAGDQVWLSQAGGENVVVSVGLDQFQTQPLAIEFPDVQSVFGSARVVTQYECTVDRKTLVKELAKAQTSTDSKGTLNLKISGKVAAKIEVSAASAGDWYEGVVPCIWTGPEKSMTFAVEDLIKFLRAFDEDEIVLRMGDDFKGNPSPVYCKEGEHEAILNQLRS